MADHAELIGEAVRVKLGTVLAGWNVVRRKTPSLPPRSTASPPVAVVCVGEEGDVERQWWPVDEASFPVIVSLFFSGDGEKLGDAVSVRVARGSVRDALNAPSTYEGSVTGFQEVTAGGSSPFALPALGANVNQSILTAKVTVYIDRST